MEQSKRVNLVGTRFYIEGLSGHFINVTARWFLRDRGVADKDQLIRTTPEEGYEELKKYGNLWGFAQYKSSVIQDDGHPETLNLCEEDLKVVFGLVPDSIYFKTVEDETATTEPETEG